MQSDTLVEKKKLKPYLTAFTSLNVSKFFRDYIKAYLYQLMSEKKRKKLSCDKVKYNYFCLVLVAMYVHNIVRHARIQS